MAYGGTESLLALRDGEHPPAVDIPLQRQRHLAEYRRGRGLAHLLSKRLLGVDDGAVGGEQAVVPVRGLLVLEDVEAGVAEERTVVVDRVVADDGEAAGALGMELEGEEGEGSTRADDAGEFAERGHLFGGVLEGVDGHGSVHRCGLEAGVGEAAGGEGRAQTGGRLPGAGESEILRALLGLRDGDGGEGDAGEASAGVAGDPEAGAA